MPAKIGGGCPICQELIHLCCYHSKHCLERECIVPFCRHIKLKLRQQQTQQLSAQEERQLKIQRCVQNLVHATQCCKINCQHLSCAKMKRVMEHTKTCQRKIGGGCPICQISIFLCCYHARRCLARVSVVPFCRHIKLKLRQRQRRRHNRQRMQALHEAMAG